MYATGAPTSLADFLNSLATFATSAGWTVDHNAVYTSGDYWLAVHKNACYLDYFVPTTNDRIQLYGATGYSGASAYNAQAGTSPSYSLMMPAPAGPFTAYHFFSTNTGGIDYLHALLEYSSGNFLHIHGGCLSPVGGLSNLIYTAGTHWSGLAGGLSSSDGGPGGASNWTPFTAENPAGAGQWCFQLLATIDSVTRWFYPGAASPARAIGAIRSGSRNVHAFARIPNTFNQLAPLIPLSLYLERAAGNIYSYVGDVIDMRFFNIANNAAKDEITIGADTWKVFPVISKQPFGSPTAATGNNAFAFRKNA
jgi:hypothetical protein